MSNNKTSNFINTSIITVLSILYILFINKLAEIISIDENDEEHIKKYALIIYFLSIIGMVIAYVWFSDNSSNKIFKNNNGNFIIRLSLNIGGLIMLVYTMMNYWDVLDNYSKLVLISFGICAILYYIYQFY